MHSLAECFFFIKRRENPASLGIEDQGEEKRVLSIYQDRLGYRKGYLYIAFCFSLQGRIPFLYRMSIVTYFKTSLEPSRKIFKRDIIKPLAY